MRRDRLVEPDPPAAQIPGNGSGENKESYVGLWLERQGEEERRRRDMTRVALQPSRIAPRDRVSRPIARLLRTISIIISGAASKACTTAPR